MRLLVRFRTACREFLDLSLSNLYLEHVEIDEIWIFVRKKQRKLHGFEIIDPEIGNIYLFAALDQRTKLLASFAIGKIRRPDSMGDERPQLFTDGFNTYPGAIAERFGSSVKHGVLIKQYRNPESGRYAPPDLIGTERIAVQNITDVTTICTSHVERNNLTIRTFVKRFTGLSIGFCKKLTNLTAAAALQIGYYNFCWRLRKPGRAASGPRRLR